MVRYLMERSRFKALRSSAGTFVTSFIAVVIVAFPALDKVMDGFEVPHSPRFTFSFAFVVAAIAAILRFGLKRYELFARKDSLVIVAPAVDESLRGENSELK